MIEDIFSSSKIRKIKPTYTSKIIIDTREKNSLVPTYLIKEGIPYQKEKLEIGDYLISDLIIERKTFNDFLSSFYSKRLINQLTNIKKYPRKILILEGDYNNLCQEKIKIIKGLILSINVKFQIPILYSSNELETSKILIKILTKTKKQYSIRILKNRKTLQEKKEYILQGFQNIGIKKSKELIKKFKTIKNIINQKQENLEKILDEKTTKEFLEIINN